MNKLNYNETHCLTAAKSIIVTGCISQITEASRWFKHHDANRTREQPNIEVHVQPFIKKVRKAMKIVDGALAEFVELAAEVDKDDVTREQLRLLTQETIAEAKKGGLATPLMPGLRFAVENRSTADTLKRLRSNIEVAKTIKDEDSDGEEPISPSHRGSNQAKTGLISNFIRSKGVQVPSYSRARSRGLAAHSSSSDQSIPQTPPSSNRTQKSSTSPSNGKLKSSDGFKVPPKTTRKGRSSKNRPSHKLARPDTPRPKV